MADRASEIKKEIYDFLLYYKITHGIKLVSLIEELINEKINEHYLVSHSKEDRFE